MNTEKLAERECEPCKDGMPPMDADTIAKYLQSLGGEWTVVKDRQIEKEFKFSDFMTALAFTNTIGQVAEEQGHHPDLELGWGRVKVTLWTHKIGGLSEADFILAARIDKADSSSRV